MQMRPALQLSSMAKAMIDVVIPSIDPTNKLAQEQARLISGLLQLMSRQLPLSYRFGCDELARQVALADVLSQQVPRAGASGDALDEMAAARTAAAALLEQAKVAPDQIEQAVHRIKAATSGAVSVSYEVADVATQKEIERSVLDYSREQTLRDRSWVLMQGWEPDPKAVPDIGTLI